MPFREKKLPVEHGVVTVYCFCGSVACCFNVPMRVERWRDAQVRLPDRPAGSREQERKIAF